MANITCKILVCVIIKSCNVMSMAAALYHIINARRACARGLQYSLCVCVCLPFSGSIKRFYSTLITTIGFVPNAKDFQLMDFSEKASFESYSIFCAFYTMAAILLC